MRNALKNKGLTNGVFETVFSKRCFSEWCIQRVVRIRNSRRHHNAWKDWCFQAFFVLLKGFTSVASRGEESEKQRGADKRGFHRVSLQFKIQIPAKSRRPQSFVSTNAGSHTPLGQGSNVGKLWKFPRQVLKIPFSPPPSLGGLEPSVSPRSVNTLFKAFQGLV